MPVLEDYYECLHHKKEVSGGYTKLPEHIDQAGLGWANGIPPQASRVRALQTAYRKAEAATPRDNVPPAGAIRNLGLLDKDEDTKAVLK